MALEDTLTNVGPSVALDVSSWEDLIPLDADFSMRAAEARQKEWCDANRHPDPHSLSGYVLFPNDPLIQESHIGPKMEVVQAAIKNAPTGLEGKVGFVVVGCVCYRAPFESFETARHETRFVYYLGKVGDGMNPYAAPLDPNFADFRLVKFPNGQTAD